VGVALCRSFPTQRWSHLTFGCRARLPEREDTTAASLGVAALRRHEQRPWTNLRKSSAKPSWPTWRRCGNERWKSWFDGSAATQRASGGSSAWRHSRSWDLGEARVRRRAGEQGTDRSPRRGFQRRAVRRRLGASSRPRTQVQVRVQARLSRRGGGSTIAMLHPTRPSHNACCTGMSITTCTTMREKALAPTHVASN